MAAKRSKPTDLEGHSLGLFTVLGDRARLGVLGLGYVAAWVLLWFGAGWMDLAVGVSLWYPPAGLTFAVLLAYGWRSLPLPILASLLAGLSIWSWAQWQYYLLANLVCPLGYLAMAQLLRADWCPCGGGRVHLSDPLSVVAFLAAAASGALFSALAGTEILRAAGLWGAGQSWAETVLGFWVGDFVGVATMAPLVLFFAVPLARRFERGESLRLSPPSGMDVYPARQAVLQLGLSALVLVLLFWAPPHIWSARLQPYALLLLLPVLDWIVMSRDMRATVVIVSLYELGIVAMVALFGAQELSFQYQLVMAAILASGLMMGTVSHGRLATNARFRDFAEMSNDVLWEVDAAGRVTEVAGRSGLAMAAQDELPGRHWSDCVVPQKRGSDFVALQRAIRGRQPFHQLVLRMRLSAARQQPVWTLNNGLPRFDEQGVFLGYRGTTSDITELKAAEEALRDSRDALRRRVDQLAALTSQLTLAEQRERHRLAMVLHDHLQQLLVAATWGLESLGQRVSAAERSDLEQIKSILDQSIGATRTLAIDLSPPVLRDGGLPEALAWLARTMESTYGLRVELSLASHASPDREDVRIVVFESVREALLNVVKHAQVARAEVELSQDGRGFVTVVIRDRGVGIPLETATHEGRSAGGFGLFAMRERLSLLGGGVKIGGVPGGGTQVTLSAPIADHAEHRDGSASAVSERTSA